MNTLFAVPLDPRRLELVGAAVPILEDVDGSKAPAVTAGSDIGDFA